MVMLGFLRCQSQFDFQNSLQDYLDCVVYTRNHQIWLHNDRQSKINQTATSVCSILSIANRDIKPPLMFSQHDVDLESIPFFITKTHKNRYKINERKNSSLKRILRRVFIVIQKQWPTLYVMFEPSFHFRCLFDSNFPPSQ